MQRSWRWLAGLAGALVFAGLALRYGSTAVSGVSRFDTASFAAYLACALVVRLGYTARWQAMAGALRLPIAFRTLFAARLAGDGLAAISPAGRISGDPLRIILSTQRSSMTRSSAAVALDRIAETAGNSGAVLGYLWILAAREPLGTAASGWLGTAMAAALVAIAYGLFKLASGMRPLAPLYRRLRGSRHESLRGIAVGMAHTERHLGRLVRRRPTLVASAIAGSLLLELLIVAEYWFLYRAFGIVADVPTVVASMLAGGIARSAPAPGGLGIFEASQVAAFAATAHDPAAGFAAGLAVRIHELLWGAAGAATWIFSKRSANLGT